MKEIKINVDSYNSDSIKTIQGNNNAEVYKIYVLFNKRRIDLTGKTVKMAYLRTGTVEGDVINLNVTNATEGEITLQITNSISKRDGVYSCQLAVYGADGFLEHTATFGLTVEANIFNQIANEIANSKDLTYIESILEEAINTSEELKSNIPVARQLNIDLLNKNGTLNETMEKANVVNNTLADTTEKSKVAATDAIEKKSKLESSIVEAKKFIDGLDGSQNIPQIRLDITELQNGLKSNQALEYSGSSISAENTLEGRTEGMRIGGRTLQNLFINKYSMNLIDSSTRIFRTSLLGKSLSKGTYTIGFTTKFNKSSIRGLRMYYESPDGSSGGYKTIANTDGKHTITIELPVDISYFLFYIESLDINEGLTCELTNIVMVKGTYSNIDFFEEIKSFGEAEYNLLDESQISIGYIGGSDGITYTIPGQDDGTRIAIIPCDPNTTYTITKEFITDRFIVGTTIEKPVHAMKVNKLSQQDNSKSITITTPGDSKYLLAYLTLDNKNKPCGKVNINKSNVPVEWSVPGKYNISILSTGKNLAKLDLSNPNIVPFEDGFKLDSRQLWGSKEDIFNMKGKYKKNTQYVFSYLGKLLDNSNSNNYRLRIYYEDGTYTDDVVCNSSFSERTMQSLSGKTINMITGYYGTFGGEFIVKDLMLEEGTQSTQYEPYKHDKKDILIKEPLRGFDENICDVIQESNGQVIVNRYARQYTFTGDENIVRRIYAVETNTIGFGIFKNEIPFKVGGIGLCNNFKLIKNPDVFWNQDDGKSFTITDFIQFRVPKTELTTQDVEGFKAWLRANPTTVVYELATPTTEIVESIDIDLDTFQDKTYFNILNSLPGTLDFKVPSNIGSVVQNMAKEVNNIWDVINNLLVPNIVKANGNLAMLKLNNNLN